VVRSLINPSTEWWVEMTGGALQQVRNLPKALGSANLKLGVELCNKVPKALLITIRIGKHSLSGVGALGTWKK